MVSKRPDPREIARRVVQLLESGNIDEIERAIALLQWFYQDEPEKIQKAYASACLVVAKKIRVQPRAPAIVPIDPKSDWKGLQISRLIYDGNTEKAFLGLKELVLMSPQKKLLREISFQLLGLASNKARVSELTYRDGRVTYLEVALFSDCGILLILNSSNATRSRSNEGHSQRAQEKAQFVILRSQEDLFNDIRSQRLRLLQPNIKTKQIQQYDWLAYWQWLSGGAAQESA